MDETKTPTETGTETPTDNPNERNESQNPSLIEQGNATAERIEKANAESKLENDRRERIVAEERLGGRTSAGQSPPTPKELSPSEYRKQVETEMSKGKYD